MKRVCILFSLGLMAGLLATSASARVPTAQDIGDACLKYWREALKARSDVFTEAWAPYWQNMNRTCGCQGRILVRARDEKKMTNKELETWFAFYDSFTVKTEDEDIYEKVTKILEEESYRCMPPIRNIPIEPEIPENPADLLDFNRP